MCEIYKIVNWNEKIFLNKILSLKIMTQVFGYKK